MLGKTTWCGRGLLTLRQVCMQIFRKLLKSWEDIKELVGIVVIRNQVLGLGTLSGACSENFTELVVIVPVTAFYGLTAPFASLAILAYLTNYPSHLATITLE